MPDDRYPGLPAPLDVEHPFVLSMRLLNPLLRRVALAYAFILSVAILPPHDPIPFGWLALVAAAAGVGWSAIRRWLERPW